MSDDVVIRVENLSKQYRIGGAKEGYRTFRETLVDAAKAPFLRAQEAWSMVHRAWSKSINSKLPASSSMHAEGTSSLPAPRSMHAEGTSALPAPRSPLSSADDTIWALKDVSFEVKRGEVVGIIGRNGAGKSTLLKILSKITEPTKGRVELRGRVGSLLEVGTGFHPELTGHENVYLYGAILGMDRWEVTRKFDEIVAFAELEKFIETPVKRYSSGMYMRLAFAVAAFMETEILLVDEVLAVGDMEFQKKCLGKMGDVASEGRTVLFISHNMAAVLNLCARAFLLHNGKIFKSGNTDEVVKHYLTEGEVSRGEVSIRPSEGGVTEDFFFTSASILKPGNGPRSQISLVEGAEVKLEYEVCSPFRGGNVVIHIWNNMGVCVFSSADVDKNPLSIRELRKPGRYIARCYIHPQYLRPGRYYLGVSSSIPNVRVLADIPRVLTFDVIDTGSTESKISQGRQGVISPILNWVTEREEDTV